jgi:hypothetical protein
MAHTNLVSSKNLDSHDSVTQAAKGSADDLTPEPLLSVVFPDTAQGGRRPRRYRPHGNKHLSLDQATNIIEAVDHARAIGLPLVAHATIHWSGTAAFDDPDGKLFAKVREGFHKWLLRRSIAGGLTCVWCRECKALTDVVHCHLLFHLPVECLAGARFLQTEAALSRLVGRHGGGIWGEFACTSSKAATAVFGIDSISGKSGANHKASFMASDAAPRRILERLHGTVGTFGC